MTHPWVDGLAIAACCLLLLGAVFQLALSAGAPWAAAAYGGRAALPDGRLPGRYRVASLITAVVLLAISWVLLLRGGVGRCRVGEPGADVCVQRVRRALRGEHRRKPRRPASPGTVGHWNAHRVPCRVVRPARPRLTAVPV